MSLSLPLNSELLNMFYLAAFEEEQSDINCEAPLELELGVSHKVHVEIRGV